MSMPEYEEVVEKPAEEPKEKSKKVKKVSRVIKPAYPEPMETVTLRSHKREHQPKDELVISLSIWSNLIRVLSSYEFKGLLEFRFLKYFLDFNTISAGIKQRHCFNQEKRNKRTKNKRLLANTITKHITKKPQVWKNSHGRTSKRIRLSYGAQTRHI